MSWCGRRVIDQGHADQTLLCGLDRFLNRQWNFSRFAGSESHVATFVTDDDKRRERKVLTTLNYLGDAIDRDHLILQIESLCWNTLLGLSS